MTAIDKVIQVAEAEIGYIEKASNANLDDKLANAGNNNFTKYARDLDNLGNFFNGSKNGYPWCFTAGTMILTDNGYKEIEDISIGDKVLNAHGTRFNEITHISSHKADVIGVKVYGSLPFYVTPDHPFLAQERVDKWHRNKGLKNWGFHEIGELKKGDMLTIPKSPVLYEDSMSYDELWVLGYYVGDGYTNRNDFIICANESKAIEVEKHADAVRGKDYASRTCLEYKLNKDGHEVLVSALRKCGKGAANKQVPECILFGSNEAKMAFIDGYLAADGSRQGHFFNTVSKKLAIGMAKILFDINIGCSVNEQHRPTQGKIWDARYNAYRTFNQREIIYNCSTNDSCDFQHKHHIDSDWYIFVPIKSLVSNGKQDIVYTLTTDGDHTYTANNLAVHNCDVFTDWCFVKAFGDVIAKSVICQPSYSAGAGCLYSANYYKQAGRWGNAPAKGDQIFFTYNGQISHTGLVVDVKNGTVYTIEGNTSGASGVIANGGGVCRKQYPIGYSSIYGYGKPRYEMVGNVTDSEPATAVGNNNGTIIKEENKKPTQTTVEPVAQNKERYKYMIELPLCKYGDEKNDACFAMQSILNARGYNCGKPDGEFGNNTKSAVIRFQRAKGLLADGECGGDTWGKLING